MSWTTLNSEGGTDGDFKLVSSDGVTFTVDTYRLQAWSNVFRDMISTGSGEKIIHLDERAPFIRQFLQLVSSGKLDFDEQRDFMPMLRKMFCLIRFLKKYECGVAIELVVGQVMTMPPKEMPPLMPFLLGVETGRPELCARALDWPELTWKAYASAYTTPSHTTVLANMLHPAELPDLVFMNLPHTYLWALVRLPLPRSFPADHPKYCGEKFLELLKTFDVVDDI